MSPLRALPILLLLFLPACGLTNKKMDAQTARQIHTIALLDVSVTRERTYVDSGAMTMGAIIGGDIGSLAVQAAESVPKDALTKALDPSTPSRILTDELAAALQRKGFTVQRIPDGPPSHRPSEPPSGSMNDGMFVKDYATVPASKADAILDAVCVNFGYQRFEFTEIDHPMITLGARLTSPDGKTIYYTQGLAFTHNSTHQNNCTNIDADRNQFTAKWSDIFNDPQRLDAQLHLAAQSLAEAIAKDLTPGR